MNVPGLSPSFASLAATMAGGVAGNSAAVNRGTPGQRNTLSEEEQAEVRKLKARDREVRQHEQAHLAAAGGLAISGASFTYQRGPDGINYAVGGEVRIDTSPGRTPEETLRRAEAIRAAAEAPAQPSSQDRAVAAQASQMANEARLALQQAEREPAENGRSTALQAYASADSAPPGTRVDAYA